MKKLLAVILIMGLILPAAAVADNFAGCWGVWIPKSATLGLGNLSFVVILNEKGTFAWTLVDDTAEELYAETVTGKWEASDNNIVITNDTGERGQLDYYDGMLWIDMSGKKVGLKRLADYETNQMIYD